MANTHLSRPAPALEMFITSSGVNFGSFMYSFTCLTWRSVRASLSKSMRVERNRGSAIMPLAPFQLTSLMLRRITTHSHTFCTWGGGFTKERISVISSFFSPCSASAAASRAGMAATSAVSASSLSAAIATACVERSASFWEAASDLALTTTVDLLMLVMSSLHSLVFWSTTTLASLSVTCILSTSSEAWISLVNPPFRRAAMSPSSVRLLSRLEW
mmetsp:Transcript_26873/g.58594  ORF Transcript_26873/g.58594 Transcript_26873/m.58594 type:complete len:216 (+) Transcript_26873:3955-4602(+)